MAVGMSSMWQKVGWLVGCMLLVWLWGTPAQAWKQTLTTTGKKPMSWHKLPIQYAVDAEGMGDYFTKNPVYGKPNSEFDAVNFSFKVWTDILCPNGGPVGLQFQSSGRVSGKTVGYDPDCGDCNTNLVKFVRVGWTRSSMEVATALTAFRDLSGEIFDSDIIINAQHLTLSSQSDNEGDIKWDIQNAVTHEVGHLLGLAHSDAAEATMFAKTGEGVTSLRTLDKDDVEGICTIYPPLQIIGKVPAYTQTSKDRGLGCQTLGKGVPGWWVFLLSLGFLGFLVRK